MTPPERESRASFWPILVVVGAAALCCVGPAVVALAAATGVGVLLARSAPYLVFGTAVVAAVVIAAAFRRHCGMCADPATPTAAGVHGSPRAARGDTDTDAHVPRPPTRVTVGRPGDLAAFEPRDQEDARGRAPGASRW